MRSLAAIVLLILIGALGGVSDAAGQNITVNNNLVFGEVFPGIPKTISKKTAGSAAEFTVSGTPGAELSIDFTLPTYMNKDGFNMQLVFTETDCAVDSSATPDQSNPGATDLDPWHTITYRLGSSGLSIWLGGLVIPKLVQPTGDYVGTIVLTVAYTGN